MPILNWLNRDETFKVARYVPYRLLEEATALSYGIWKRAIWIVQGDNLDALKALLP